MKFIQSTDKALIEELVANLFEVVAPNHAEILEAEGLTSLKFDEEALTDSQLMIIETALSARIQGGVLPADCLNSIKTAFLGRL